MMVVVFAAMTLALAAGRWGPRPLATAVLLACLALAAGLFLFEIYSPDTGFRMPWLQVKTDGAAGRHA